MYKKICPVCRTTSYSISVDQTWLCPNCQHDLTNVETIHFATKRDSDSS